MKIFQLFTHMRIVRSPLFLLVVLMMLNHFTQAQQNPKPCKEIDVKVEVINEQFTNSVVTISFKGSDEGNFKIQLLDSKGELKTLNDLIIRDLLRGEYDLIITDKSKNSDWCPYYKRIKIDGQ